MTDKWSRVQDAITTVIAGALMFAACSAIGPPPSYTAEVVPKEIPVTPKPTLDCKDTVVFLLPEETKTFTCPDIHQIADVHFSFETKFVTVMCRCAR